MAQVINTNVGALFAGAALNKSANALQTAQARLSSGLRINSAKDDATGLTVATALDSKIRGTNMAIRNVNDGISNAQTADGLLSQVNDNLQRMREISVQTAGKGSAESTALDKENTRILGLSGLTGVPVGTKVVNDQSGGTYTTTGGVPAVTAAAAAQTTADYATAATDAAAVLGAVGALAIAAAQATADASAATAAASGKAVTTAFDTDIAAVGTARAGYGADMVSLSSAVANLQTSSVNLSASYSRVMDTDYAAEAASMARNNILQQAGTAILAQANQTPQSVLGLLR